MFNIFVTGVSTTFLFFKFFVVVSRMNHLRCDLTVIINKAVQSKNIDLIKYAGNYKIRFVEHNS